MVMGVKVCVSGDASVCGHDGETAVLCIVWCTDAGTHPQHVLRTLTTDDSFNTLLWD